MSSTVLHDVRNPAAAVMFGDQNLNLRITKVEGVGIVCLTVNTGNNPDALLDSADPDTLMMNWQEGSYLEFASTGAAGTPWDIHLMLADYETNNWNFPSGQGKARGHAVIHYVNF